jgi:hypothetical protein
VQIIYSTLIMVTYFTPISTMTKIKQIVNYLPKKE